MDNRERTGITLLFPKEIWLLAAGLLFLGGLSFKNYLLFHSLVEQLCIFVIWGIAILVVQMAAGKDRLLIPLSAAFFMVGVFDLLHVLALNGVIVFTGGAGASSDIFWIATRLSQAFIFLLVPLVVTGHLPQWQKTGIAALVGAGLFAIMFMHILPDAIPSGTGAIWLKNISQMVIIGLIFFDMAFLRRMLRRKHSLILALLWRVFLMLAAAEIYNLLFPGDNGGENMISHLLRLVAFYYLFKVRSETYLALPIIEETKRKAAEAALRQSEEKYRLLFENCIDGIILIHPDDRISAVNAAACQILNRTAEEIIRLGLPGLINLSAAEIIPLREKLRQNGKVIGEIAFPRQDGSVLPLEFSVFSFTEGNGQIVSPIFFSDISKRKKAEAELRQTVAILERVKRIRGVGYWTLDLKYHDLFWSEEARKIYVGDADFDLTYANALALTHPDDAERTNQAVNQAIIHHRPVQIEHRIIRPDGHEAVVDVDIEVDYGLTGEAERLFGTIVDVSWQWQAEKVLQENAEKLLALDRLKNVLLAYTSHELKTPLNAIIGISQALIETPREIQPKDQKEYLSIISSCGRRLANLIDDMGEAFRLWPGNSRNIQLQQKSLSLNEVIRPLRDGLQLLNKNQKLTFSFDFPADLPIVWADEDRLKQILNHLIDNAYKFTEAGRITLSAVREGEMVRITVADTGSGIAAGQAEEINHLFSRSVLPPADQQIELGFGLAITKYLVELHHGTITLESAEGRGAEFSFTLPVSAETSTEIAQAGMAGRDRLENWHDPLDLPKFSNQTGDKILIVADDQTNSLAISSILQLEGYSIVSAENQDQAIAMINEMPQLSLAIIDLTRTGVSGNALCRSIRQTKDQYILPILMLVAANRSDDLLAGFAAGVSDFLTKPIELYKLRARVHTLIDLQKSFAQALRSEVKFLQSQIKPHFIHNALHTIISISRTDTEKARSLLVEFSNYLRGCFYFENLLERVPIQTEINLVKSYIAIEQARFGRNLQVVYVIESDRIRVPPLIIQPLVENAVVHGLRPKQDGGRITVEVGHRDKKLMIRITDNGVGMAAEKVSQLLDAAIVQEGVGISNINQRLKRLFGSKLSIESWENIGTVIQMELLENDDDGKENS